MYRINLYPAGASNRAARAGAVRRTALVTLVAGFQLGCLVLFVIAAQSVGVRARNTEARVLSQKERMEQQIVPGGRAVFNQARLLVDRRARRSVWWPVLDEIRENLPRDLILERVEITGSEGSGGVSGGLLLFGRLRAGNDVDQVVACIDRLVQSPVYRAQFERARLDRVDNNQDVARFVIACPLLRPVEADSSGEGSGG